MKTVLVVGLGVAGPALAYWLRERGFKPTIVERAPAPRDNGYMIDFWGAGYDVAERMGVLGPIREAGYAIQDLRLVNEEGRRVAGFGIAIFRKLSGGRFTSLPRGRLSAILHRHIRDRIEIIFGDTVAALHQDSSGVDVEFERSTARHFDLVVGADGQHSVVRALAFGPESGFERYLGYMVAAFSANHYQPRDPDVYVAHAVPGCQIARVSMRDDRTMFLLVAAEPHPPAMAHDQAAAKAWVARRFAGIGWEGPRIMEAMAAADDLYFDRVSQIRLPAWTKDRVALIGDAAAAPSLLAGQGSALAMLEAYVLAGEMSRAEEGAPFGNYERLLRPFLHHKQVSAARFAGSFAPRTAFGLAFRKFVLRLLWIPGLARLAIGPGLLDRFVLPEY